MDEKYVVNVPLVVDHVVGIEEAGGMNVAERAV
jgi:hypothetical protein